VFTAFGSSFLAASSMEHAMVNNSSMLKINKRADLRFISTPEQ